MQLNICAKQVEITETLASAMQRRVDKFARYWNRVTMVDVVAEKRGTHTYFLEYIVHAEGHQPFVSKEKHDDLYAAIDLAAGKVERQLRQYHGRLVAH